MSTAMTAKEISEAWLSYIDETFMVENGCGRKDVEEALQRLEETGQLGVLRERHRMATDLLLSEILRSAAEPRGTMYSMTDALSLALVQDRIRCGTELLVAFVQKGLQMKIEGEQALEQFFRKMLYQTAE